MKPSIISIKSCPGRRFPFSLILPDKIYKQILKEVYNIHYEFDQDYKGSCGWNDKRFKMIMNSKKDKDYIT